MLDQTIFVLSDKQFTAFSKALDAPPIPNEKLKKLMAAKAPWSEDTCLRDPQSDLYDI